VSIPFTLLNNAYAIRPGNRGKRDSQMILMRFLNRIHYNLPMTPMELEMHHQVRNIIGVNPTFYEYCLQIDADTVVAPDSATRMIASFMQDTRLIGVCGETALTNAKASMVTMIQVYEYYISHNLTKAFESLFGSVTCLPGCFSMYRIRAAETGKPLFVSKEVVEGYAVNRVDTLHMKNLLSLGEDRYLTTLLLKHHAKYKTKYIFRAHAWTIAPDSWAVFLSQRRRWINSTVHNLMELMSIDGLCGFCCFSMRFIVFIDLLSTIVQPVLMGYIIYLIYLIVSQSSIIPMTAFILLGAIYGLQAIIFIARRKWEMVGWMIVYVIATPIFSFALPLYSFWHMDDFSWGNTRIVTGDKGQKLVISDEGVFDPSSIPKKRWADYQAELWEMHSQYQQDAMSAAGWADDNRSEVSAMSYGAKSLTGGHTPGGLSAPRSEVGGYTSSRPLSQFEVARPNATSSRVSLAPTAYGALTGEDPAAAGSGAIDLQSLSGAGSAVNAGAEGQPTDDMLLREIQDVLRNVDLMHVTKKDVRAELERRFGVNLASRKEYIGSATEAVVNRQL
jgi:chitin synthase